jgi:hypothetical protein
MQPVTWSAAFTDGSRAYEFDPKTGKETIFTEVLPRKGDMILLNLAVGQPGNCSGTYTIDLRTGEVILCGQIVHPAKEIDGRLFRLTNLPVKYAEGVIQFKCSCPIIVGVTKQVIAATYNIGYKVALPPGYITYTRCYKGVPHSVVEVTHAQPLISIDAETFQASLSVSATVKITNLATKEETLVRI